MRRVFQIVVVIVAGVGFFPPSVRAGGPAPGSSTASVAVSLRGSIVVLAANGGGKAIITRSGNDHAPVMAPNGKAIAFWRGSSFGSPQTVLNTVMIARPNGHGHWIVSRFSQRTASAYTEDRTLTWSLDSRALAWFDGQTVQYRRLGGQQRTVLHVGLERDIAAGLAISGDGGTIAASLPPFGSGTPHTLRLAVRHLSAATQYVVTIAFRPGVITAPGARGSVPVGVGLSYTTSQLAAPGHTLEFPTELAGAGLQMTGIFLAPDTGGRARLVMGNGHGLHGIPPFGTGMNGATHFQIAPNRQYTSTDPTSGFYVAGQIGPFHVSVPMPASCVLAQWTWLADSTHIAYVMECTRTGSPAGYRLALSTVSIFGSKPVKLYSTTASKADAIDLAPAYRCVACG